MAEQCRHIDQHILIIDDEADICSFFERLLSRAGYQVAVATSGHRVAQLLDQYHFDVAMVDLQLPDTTGIELLRQIKARQADCRVIIMTGYSTIKTAVEAMQYGAFDYIEKPFDDIDTLEQLIARAAGISTTEAEFQGAGEWAPVVKRIGMFVGRSEVMRRLIGMAYRLAGKDINILIQGDTGTGKEVLARFIHVVSKRADHPFIAVNCGALPENLLESELFGHERGAFTGANQVHRGIFELAHNGTLFLDEIGDASPAIQVRLLRVLESGEFCRIGGEKTIRTDVRILSASNVNLEEAVGTGRFREDLYYRLNVVQLDIPTLAERSADIPALSEHLLQGIAPQLQLHSSAAELLQCYRWPGNIRELTNILRQAAALCDNGVIKRDELPGRLLTAGDSSHLHSDEGTAEQEQLRADDFWRYYADEQNLRQLSPGELNQLLLSLHGLEKKVIAVMRGKGMQAAPGQALEDTEAETIKKALELNRWNITATAKLLGIARNTLHRKIKKYALDRI